MADVKHIDIKEFREQGYLSELNRRFLHPLGLALSVKVDDDGSETLDGVWDYREDSEGMLFGGDYAEVVAENAIKIDKLWEERSAARTESLGYMVQPPDEVE